MANLSAVPLERRKKMSDAHLGKPAPHNSYPRDDEHRQKISASKNPKSGEMNITYRAASGYSVVIKGTHYGSFPTLDQALARREEIYRGQNLQGDDFVPTEIARDHAPKSRGPCPEETKQKIGDAQRGVPREYLRGKPRPNNKSGHYGISYRKDLDCWFVRLHNKTYGSFATIEEAILRRDEVLKLLETNEPIETKTSLTFNGESHTIPEWATIINQKPATINKRIREGMPIDRVLAPGKLTGKS